MPFQRFSAILVIAAASSCDFPTDPPIVEQRWVLPLEAVTLEQEQLLPDEVTVQASSYLVDVDDPSAAESLGDLCPACVALDGLVAPTPMYQGAFSTTVGLPIDVLSVDLTSGSVDITIDNGLSFDPLAGGGTLTLTVAGAGGGPTLGSVVLDGAGEALPPGSQATRSVVLSGGVVTGGLETSVSVEHVGGVVTTIDISEEVSISGLNTTLMVAAITVAVDGRATLLTESPVEVSNIDAFIVDGVQGGTVILDVTNPYGASFDGSVEIGTVVKSVAVPSTSVSSVDISFSAAELQSFLGKPAVTLRGSGTLRGGPSVLTPGNELAIETTIDLTVRLGG